MTRGVKVGVPSVFLVLFLVPGSQPYAAHAKTYFLTAHGAPAPLSRGPSPLTTESPTTHNCPTPSQQTRPSSRCHSVLHD